MCNQIPSGHTCLIRCFNTPDNKPYVETYLTIQSGSIAQVLQENGNYSGKLHVQMIFRQNDSIINFGKYVLTSPEIKDTLANSLNFLDVQRYSLPVGNLRYGTYA